MLKTGPWDMKTVPCAKRRWRADLPVICLPGTMVQFDGRQWLVHFPSTAVQVGTATNLNVGNSPLVARIEARWIPLSECLPRATYTRLQRKLVLSALRKLETCSAPLTVNEVSALECNVAKIQTMAQELNKK
jgi:hypothetical protein